MTIVKKCTTKTDEFIETWNWNVNKKVWNFLSSRPNEVWTDCQKMPSGKRQLRSASSDSRNPASPLAGGTYIKKETPGGLQSESELSKNILCDRYFTISHSFKNILVKSDCREFFVKFCLDIVFLNINCFNLTRFFPKLFWILCSKFYFRFSYKCLDCGR